MSNGLSIPGKTAVYEQRLRVVPVKAGLPFAMRPALVVAFTISLAFLGWAQIPQFVTIRTGTGWTTTSARRLRTQLRN